MDCSRIIRDSSVQTALAVLPIFASGARGCFVNLAANNDLQASEVVDALRDASAMDGPPVAAVHYGYPHFTKQVRAVIQYGPFVNACCQAVEVRRCGVFVPPSSRGPE